MFIPLTNPLRFRRRRFFWKGKKITWKQIGKVALWGSGIFLVLIILIFAIYAKDLPTPEKIAQQVASLESTQLFDRNGQLLYSFSGDKKLLTIPFSDIPDIAKRATVAVEDKEFYNHFGIHFRSVLRALLNNVFHLNRRVQGGSTITQQLVKNSLLTPKRTFSRKIKEVILAVELEALYPKDKILELYLNSIPYGSNIYGIEAASRTFFGKTAKELSLSEAATLAALPQAPTYYSPYGSHKEELLGRKNYVLDQMVRVNSLTKEQAAEAKQQPVHFVARRESITAPHFVFYIRELLADRYGEKVVNQGGLKITTTLDLNIQKLAEKSVEDGSKKLDRFNANNAAMVVIEPSTGEILAMVGSRDYFNDEISGQVNVTTASRQPGSAFKPIVYATAFKQGYSPSKILYDVTTNFNGYRPHNYTGQTYGAVTIRQALANSLNIPAVKMLALVGINESLKTAKELGISTLTDPNRYGLALVLGGGEVRLVDLTGAYAAFGNEGRFNPPVAIKKIETTHGEILEEYANPPNKPMIPDGAAYMISNILSDHEARNLVFGPNPNLTVPDRPVAVKTGTTSEFHDAWTIGYTPQIAAGVWVGNTNNKAMKRGADGSVLAAPIWNAFMREYLKDKEPAYFKQPNNVEEVIIGRLSGKLPTDASVDIISDLFFSDRKPTEYDDVYKKVKVNKLNGKIATELTPKDLVEERVFGYVRSEKPDDPNWEEPVRAWAAEHGLDNRPPTEKDDLYSITANQPTISLLRPKNNDNIIGELTTEANVSAQFGVKRVEFYIDNVQITQVTNSPYIAKYNTSLLKDGVHTVLATVYDQNGASATSSVTIIVSNTLKTQAIPTPTTQPPLTSPPSVSTPAPTLSPTQ